MDCLVLTIRITGAFSGAGATGLPGANLLLALMKGFRDAAGNALSLIVGSLIGASRTTSVTVWAVMKGR